MVCFSYVSHRTDSEGKFHRILEDALGSGRVGISVQPSKEASLEEAYLNCINDGTFG